MRERANLEWIKERYNRDGPTVDIFDSLYFGPGFESVPAQEIATKCISQQIKEGRMYLAREFLDKSGLNEADIESIEELKKSEQWFNRGIEKLTTNAKRVNRFLKRHIPQMLVAH